MITLKIPYVAREFRPTVEANLIGEWLDNVKFASLGLAGAWSGYCLLVYADQGLRGYEWLLAVQWSFGVLAIAYVFWGERFFAGKSKLLVGDLIIGATLTSAGLGFYFQLPNIADPALRILGYGICVGVLGAAAFAFAPSKRSFLIFAAGWAGPLEFYLLFQAPSTGFFTLGITQIIYVGVLILIGRVDYVRRVESILKELKLQRSNAIVTELKNQQDGDYYLTSLLLQPLQRNNVPKTNPVNVSFVSEPYKKFEYRNRQNALGGDFISAHTLQLHDIDCTVFINADAMGKSMQGAGGALVLGAIFELMIERTRVKSEYASMYPERWLKSMFLELHKAFEGFEGTMLVSAFIGVIENPSGILYHINAEHPAAVLYREGEAVFLEEKRTYAKLGAPGILGDVTVNMTRLIARDVLIVASDGRDDIYLSDETGRKTVNADERRFLRTVQAARGELSAMHAALHQTGELKDDVSIVRISFEGAAKPKRDIIDRKRLIDASRNAMKLLRISDYKGAGAILRQLEAGRISDPQIFRVLIRLAFKAREYSLAIKWAEQCHRFSEDIDLIYLASVAHKRLSNFDSARDLFERINLRGVRSEKITAHLSDIEARTRGVDTEQHS